MEHAEHACLPTIHVHRLPIKPCIYSYISIRAPMPSTLEGTRYPWMYNFQLVYVVYMLYSRFSPKSRGLDAPLHVGSLSINLPDQV